MIIILLICNCVAFLIYLNVFWKRLVFNNYVLVEYLKLNFVSTTFKLLFDFY